MVFLDSNICIAAMSGHHSVASRLLQTTGRTAVSTIVAAELRYGADHSAHPEHNHQRIDEFLRFAVVVPFSEKAAASYGKTRHALQIQGSLIGERDLLIASEALAADALLITHNTGEFSRVKGLRLADWLS